MSNAFGSQHLKYEIVLSRTRILEIGK